MHASVCVCVCVCRPTPTCTHLQTMPSIENDNFYHWPHPNISNLYQIISQTVACKHIKSCSKIPPSSHTHWITHDTVQSGRSFAIFQTTRCKDLCKSGTRAPDYMTSYPKVQPSSYFLFLTEDILMF